MKVAVENGGQPFAIAFWQAVFAGIFLYLYLLFKHGHLGVHHRHLKLLFILGFLGSALPGVLFYWSLSNFPNAGMLSMTVSFIPIMTYVFALLLKTEKFVARRIIGVIISGFALCIIVIPGHSLPNRTDVIWFLIACGAAVSYALENLVIDTKSPKELGAVRVACGMNFMAAIMVCPIAFLFDHSLAFSFSDGYLEGSLILLGLINAVSYSMFVFLITRTGPVFASQTGYVVTIGGIIWGIVLFGESHSNLVWISLVFIILGVRLVAPRD